MKYTNNPFNIRSGSKWSGLIGNKNGFCEFYDVAYSVRVFLYLVKRTYVKRLGPNYTLEQFINFYCPPGDGNNNPSLYVDFVIDFMTKRNVLCVTKSSRPATFSFSALYTFAAAVCKMESNYVLKFNEFNLGYNWL